MDQPLSAVDLAHQALIESASLAKFARSRIALFWFPMLVFGSISLGAAVVAALVGPGPEIGLYWLIVGGLGAAATARFYSQRHDEIGLLKSARPHLGIVAVLAIGVFTLPLLVVGDPGWATCGWTGLCYAGFAVVERSKVIGLCALTMIVGALAIRTFAVDTGTVLSSLLVGAMLLAGGKILRSRYHRL